MLCSAIKTGRRRRKEGGCVNFCFPQITVVDAEALIPWEWLNSHLLVGSGALIPNFALLVHTHFTYKTVPQVFSLSPFLFSPLSCCRGSEWVALWGLAAYLSSNTAHLKACILIQTVSNAFLQRVCVCYVIFHYFLWMCRGRYIAWGISKGKIHTIYSHIVGFVQSLQESFCRAAFWWTAKCWAGNHPAQAVQFATFLLQQACQSHVRPAGMGVFLLFVEDTETYFSTK